MGFSCGDSSVKLLGIASLPKKLCQKEIPPSPKKETPLPEGGNCLTEVTLDNANCRLSTLIPAYYRPFPHLLTRSRLYLPYPPRSLLTASSSSFPLHSLFIPSSFPLHSFFIPSSFFLHSLFILSSFSLYSLFILVYSRLSLLFLTHSQPTASSHSFPPYGLCLSRGCRF